MCVMCVWGGALTTHSAARRMYGWTLLLFVGGLLAAVVVLMVRKARRVGFSQGMGVEMPLLEDAAAMGFNVGQE
jgi:hypothetical protein